MKFLSLNNRGPWNPNQIFKDDGGHGGDGDGVSALQLLAAIAASSNSSGKSPSETPQPQPLPPTKIQPNDHATTTTTTTTTATSTPRMLDNRILIAMFNLRSAMEEIETAQLPRSCKEEQKQNLIVAVCSLESAMENMGDAEVASRPYFQLNNDNNENYSFQGSYLEEEDDDDDDADDDESAYNRVLCCLDSYELELDGNSVTTDEDTSSVRFDKDAERILVELKREEAMLRQVVNMSMAMQTNREQVEGINVSPFIPVLISGSDNEGRHQFLSAVAPSCRLCGGNHWKFRCPAMQDAFLFQDDSTLGGHMYP
jgi:hypothetical protein